MYAALTQAGVPASFIRINGAGHGFAGAAPADLERAYAALVQWFEQYLGSVARPRFSAAASDGRDAPGFLRGLVESDQGHEGRESGPWEVTADGSRKGRSSNPQETLEGRLPRSIWRGESLITQTRDIFNRRAPEEPVVLAAEL